MDTPSQTELWTATQVCDSLGIARSTLTYWMLTKRIIPAQTIKADPTTDRATLHLFARADVERLAAERAAS